MVEHSFKKMQHLFFAYNASIDAAVLKMDAALCILKEV